MLFNVCNLVVKNNESIENIYSIYICKCIIEYMSVYVHASPCFGRSSKGKIHVNPHVKSQESLLIDPEEKHIKYLTKFKITGIQN